jgi:hypothetical protein
MPSEQPFRAFWAHSLQAAVGQLSSCPGWFLLALFLAVPSGALQASDRVTLIPVGAPFYTPDTSFGLGAYVVTVVEPKKCCPHRVPDEYSGYAAVTMRRQFIGGFTPTVYFNDGLLKLKGKLEGGRYPTYFWGAGQDTRGAPRELYTPLELLAETELLFELAKGLYLGPALHARFVRMQHSKPGGALQTSGLPGADGTIEVGAGAQVSYDSRDSIFYPLRGSYLEGTFHLNEPRLGSEHRFQRLKLDLAHFFGLGGQHVLAVQALAFVCGGDITLQSMGFIGGNRMMRGMYQYRFVDRNSVAAQVEYRFPIYWRFGGVLFGGAGEVAHDLNDYRLQKIQYAGGGGLRFLLDPAKKVNLRIDCGADQEGTPNFYILVKEAF